MDACATPDLHAPFTSDVLLEVREGKMKRMDGLHIESGIDKQLCAGPVTIGTGGITGDEHDYTFHGGPDKAVHGYCCSHYRSWQAEFPSAAERFKPGGFGENFVTRQMNEFNVCIADVVSVGGADGVLLQVSLPRQPCFKLNHRFRLKGFAPNTWKTHRTGWYYRVLQGGTVRAGDEIRLVQRPYPEWTIARLQEHMYRVKDDAAANALLADMPELGAECRDMFRGRVAKQQREATRQATAAAKWRPYRIAAKTRQTPRITSFTLEALSDADRADDAEPVGQGAHARIRLGNGLERSYSIVGGDRARFELGVAREELGRGGSRYLHDVVGVGHTVHVGTITAAIPSAGAASHRVFVAGGVGITAFLPLLEVMDRIHYSFVLHYAVRSEEDIPFRDRLGRLGEERVLIYDASQGHRMDIGRIVRALPWNSFLYFCGPPRMMEAALRETRAQGVPQSDIHYEAFVADTGGDPFEAVVANAGEEGQNGEGDTPPPRIVKVGGEETLLDVLRREFGEDTVQSSCEAGNCGTCKIRLRDGRVEHRGTALLDGEKPDSMLSCVSRGIGRITVEL